MADFAASEVIRNFTLKILHDNLMRHIFVILCMLTVLTACNNQNGHSDWSKARQEMEAHAQDLLTDARAALGQRKFDAARQHIKTMREECNLALEAREQGILLMDSIDLQEAIHEMMITDSLLRTNPQESDSLKWALEEYNNRIKFYRRKLEHDKNADKMPAETADNAEAINQK